MIEVIGIEGSSENRAAITIAAAIKSLWPEVEDTPLETDHIRIASDVKISGYKVSDIDVVVCGQFKVPRYFRPRRILRDRDGKRLLLTRPVAVQSFIFVVEVKEHSGEAIKVVGEKVQVRYSRGGPPKWKSATDQNIDQVHSLKSYLEDRIGASPFVRRCLLLPNLYHLRCGGTVGGDFDGHQLFSAVAETSPMPILHGRPTLSATDRATMEQVLLCPLFKQITPSNLDRQRMDRIAKKGPATGAILANAGKHLTLLRGQGGTGKTVALLQAAWRLFRERGERTLFLTYNHALAADLKRLMALLGVPSALDEGGVAIETVMSFMYSWVAGLRLLDDEELHYDDYPRILSEALQYLDLGTVSQADIEALREENSDRFDFDHIFVDEGQDWPAHEVRLLNALYGSSRLCVADGVDQLIRGERVDWLRAVPAGERTVVPLKACLRMKRNLSLFVAEAAKRANLGWDMTANENAGGGRILLLMEGYAAHQAIHKELLGAMRAAGNSEIDYLFCVPPSSVTKCDDGRHSNIAGLLTSWGHQTWDGVDLKTRMDFPRSPSEFRVVQYESCRGLEGWTVVLEGLDEYIEMKRSMKVQAGLTASEKEGYVDLQIVANQQAWRHALIALTRPIDTLVITLHDPSSRAAYELLELADDFPDTVELIAK